MQNKRAHALFLFALLAAGAAACRKSQTPGQPPTYNNSAGALIAKLRAEEPVPERPASMPASAPSKECMESVELLAASPGGRLARTAREQLTAAGSSGIQAILLFLQKKDSDERSRANAAMALGEFNKNEACAAAASAAATLAAADSQERTRQAALVALARLGKRFVLPRLLLCLKYEKSAIVATELARTLAVLGNHAGIAGVVELINRGKFAEVEQEAAGLARYLNIQLSEDAGEAEVRQTLDAVLYHWVAAGVVTGAPPPADNATRIEYLMIAEQLGETDLRIVDDARFILACAGAEGLEALQAALDSPRHYTRVRAMEVLGRLGVVAAPAVPQLLNLRFDPAHRAEPLLALGRIRDRRATPVLVESLRDADFEVRMAAARGLVAMADPAAAAELRAAAARAGAPAEFVEICQQALAAMEPSTASAPHK